VPIIGTRVTVTDSPTLIYVPRHGSAGDPRSGSILNLGPADIDLGGETVSTGAAYLFRKNATMDLDLLAGDELYGVAPSGQSAVVSILKLRQ
jgi:hypothetical protein